MSRAIVFGVLALSMLTVIYATEPGPVSEPTSITFIPSRMKLADTVEIPYWLYVLFIIIAVCQVCGCCCGCCYMLLGGASAAFAGPALYKLGATSHAKKVLQAIL